MPVKETLLDGVAWFAAKLIVQKLTAETVNWINSGFQGNPAFVTDPGQFFLDVGMMSYRESYQTNGFTNSLCSPFKIQVRLALVKNYSFRNIAKLFLQSRKT